MYKQAAKQKLRFETSVGMITTEQLWNLSLSELDAMAVELEKKVETSAGRKSFLKTKTETNKTAQLRFDICIDVLNTKLEEQEKAQTALETKEHNQKILAIIAQKKEGALSEMSIDELEKQLRS